MQEIEQINKNYYDSLYKKSNPFSALIHSIISFDQQSKSKVNFLYLQRIIKTIPEKKIKYLDYGCGHGSLLFKFNSGVSLFGTDISINALDNISRIGKMLGKEVTSLTHSELELPQYKNMFDIISCSHVLEHVSDDIKLVEELNSILSNGGFLLVNVPVNEVRKDPKHARNYTQESITKLLHHSGFSIMEYREIDKLTGFILSLEKIKVMRIVTKVLRLFLAVSPLKIVNVFERVLPSRFQNQQLIVLARK